MSAPSGYRWLQGSKYPGTCTRCGEFLPAGSPIYWSKETSAVLCIRCGDEAAPAPTQPVVAGTPDEEWRQLVAYLKRCVTLDTSNGFIDATDKRWAALRLQSEELINGAEPSIPITPEIEEMAKQLTPGDVLQYGWPTVVVIDNKGVRRLAPMLVTELESPQPGDTHVHASDDPYLNPSLAASEHFDKPDVDAVATAFNEGIPVGQPDALAVLLDQAAQALGLAERGINRTHLDLNLPDGEGLFNVAVVIRTQNSIITQALLQELTYLENRTDWQDTAAAHLLNAHRPAAARDRSLAQPFVAPVALNDSQEQLINRVCEAPLTVATGPPGTGKSQVVVASVANSWIRNESTLLVSTNNAAVNVAVDRARSIAPPALIRTGNKTFRDNLPALVSCAVDYASSVQIDEASTRRDLASVLSERNNALTAIAVRSELNASLSENLDAAEISAMAVWASRSAPESVDLAATAEQLAKVRRAWFFRKRKRRQILQAVGAQHTTSVEDLATWVGHRTAFESHRSELRILNESLEHVDLNEIGERWQTLSQELVRTRVAQSILSHERSITAFGTLRGGGPGLANTIRQALGGLRGWACTALSLKQKFPLEAGLFDHVIVDEASQCSLAVVLPAAYRAKRLTLVGDPNQLSPIIGLNEDLVRDVAKASGLNPQDLVRRGLDYRSGSAFSAFAGAAGADDIQLLDEHFRCHPLIARWFNTMFYGGRLTVLTDVGEWPAGERGLQWIDNDGVAERPPNSSTINRHEAEILMGELESLLDGDTSVGVVTPFSGQAGLIRQVAEQRFGAERLAASDFTVGTAHRFQGNERDIILFSTVIAPGINPRTARWVEQQRNLLNVAASRARRALVVFGHPTATSEFCPTLASLRAAAIEGPDAADPAWAIHSESEARLLEAMHSASLAPALKPSEQGFELDFAIVTPSIRLNVEVDGSQHRDERGRQRRRDIARDRVLEGLGWVVVRYPSWRCLEEPDAVAKDIVERIAAASMGKW